MGNVAWLSWCCKHLLKLKRNVTFKFEHLVMMENFEQVLACMFVVRLLVQVLLLDFPNKIFSAPGLQILRDAARHKL